MTRHFFNLKLYATKFVDMVFNSTFKTVFQMLIIFIQYKSSDSLVSEHKPAHKLFLQEQVAQGNFITAGTRSPNTGEVILSCLDDLETLHNILHKDPYYSNRVGQYEIIEFTPDISCQHLEEVVQNRE